MSDRDRLIELMLNSEPFHERDMDDDFVDGELEIVADHLLANGVIVPPCKVGDTVYFDRCGCLDAAEIDGINITAQGISFTWVQYDIGVDITELWDEGEFDLDDFGKTVFLSREEAEKALYQKGERK